MTKTHIIDYKSFGKNFNKEGTFKVKNCISDFQAKFRLEDYLKRKYQIDKLIVLDCKPDLSGAFSMFNDIFK